MKDLGKSKSKWYISDTNYATNIRNIYYISLMGGQGSKQESKKEKGMPDMSAIHKEYMPAYEECKKNPNFFGRSALT